MLINGGDRLFAALFLPGLDTQLDWVREGEAVISSCIGSSLNEVMRKFLNRDNNSVYTGSLTGGLALKKHGAEMFVRDVVPYLRTVNCHATVHVGSPGKKISQIVFAAPEARGDQTVWYGEF